MAFRSHIRPTLLFIVIFALFALSILIQIPSYLQAKNSIITLGNILAEEREKATIQNATHILTDAIHTLSDYVELVNEDNLSIDPNMKALSATYAALVANKNYDWVDFITPEGSFIASYRHDDKIIGTVRVIGEDGKAHVQQFSKSKSDEWVQIDEYSMVYDPRNRPFWIAASKSKQGVWTKPYMTATPKQPSIAYAQAQYIKGQFVGVWTIEFRLKTLNEVFTGGEIYIVTDDKTLVASSQMEIWEIEQVSNQELLKIMSESGKRVVRLDGKSAYVQRFPPELGLPWNLITITSTKTLLETLDRQAFFNVVIILLIAIAVGIIAILFLGKLSSRLKAITHEMEELEKFHFTQDHLSDKRSHVPEVDQLCTTLDHLKSNLFAFSKYVPLELVQELIQNGQTPTLSGRKVEMSVLFSDIANFTELAETLPPDTLLGLLGEYLQAMSNAIQANHGEVDKYVGDAIMAIWGAPVPLENHPLHACEAALAMKEELKLLANKWKEEGKPILTQRIGINTGIMVVGNIGSSNHFEYTAIGDAVNLASRLEGLSKFYHTQILIGEETAKAVQGSLVVRALDWVFVKGKHQSTPIYELLGPRSSIPPIIMKGIETYQKGLNAYRNRDFAKAATLFEAAKEQFGEDTPSEIMRQKSLSFQENPPPTDWEGVTLMREK